jgi:hypothetical protein
VPARKENSFLAGFDPVLSTCSRLALSGGLKRPQSKSFDRLRTLSKAEGPGGRIFHEDYGFMKSPG